MVSSKPSKTQSLEDYNITRLEINVSFLIYIYIDIFVDAIQSLIYIYIYKISQILRKLKKIPKFTQIIILL